jgi:rod shape-determining protein MreD
MDKTFQQYCYIGVSIIISLMLMIMPLPVWAQWLRPLWTPLVVFYWALAVPHLVGVGVAWMIGLLMDVLLGLPLGEEALLLALATYVISKFHQRIRMFPLSQQMVMIFVLTVFYYAAQYWLQVMLRETPPVWTFWLPSLTTAILWPWVFVVLRDYRRRCSIG